MHLYIITRGIKTWSDQFITELQGKYLQFRYRAPGAVELSPVQVQLAVRPIQLYELVFPEDCKDIVLNTVLGEGYGEKKRPTQHKRHEKYIFALRKMLGVEKIPNYKKDLIMPVTRQNIEVIGIGVKKDYWVNLSGAPIYNPTEEQKKTCFEGL